MPLRDHFRSPVNDKHSWDEVHGQWPAEIVRQLFTILPAGYQAAPKVHLGSPVEVDIGTFDSASLASDNRRGQDDSGTTTLTLPAPTLTVEADLSEQDQYEVLIYDMERGRRLVAAIEIVSPSNKDRPENRKLFANKVASLLQKDVCVSIVDLVSDLHANLYAELLDHIRRNDPQLAANPTNLYAVSLWVRKHLKRTSLLDAWYYPMTVGQPLPTLPIALSPDLRIILPLETSYEETCRLLHIV